MDTIILNQPEKGDLDAGLLIEEARIFKGAQWK